MAYFNLNGQVLVKNLKQNFRDEFGCTLRVYSGESNHHADDNSKLSDVRIGRSESQEVRVVGNMTVASFENRFKDSCGIKVKVYSPNDDQRISGSVSLAKAADSVHYRDENEENNDTSDEVETNDNGLILAKNSITLEYVQAFVSDPNWFSFFGIKNSVFAFLGMGKSTTQAVKINEAEGKKHFGYEVIINPPYWNNFNLEIEVHDINKENWFVGMRRKDQEEDKKAAKIISKLIKEKVINIEYDGSNENYPIHKDFKIKNMTMVKEQGLTKFHVADSLKKQVEHFYTQINNSKKILLENGIEL